MSRLAVLFAGVLILSACTVSPHRMMAPEVEAETQAQNPFNEDSSLPTADFPPTVLYQLLVAELAGQRGQFDIAVTNYLNAAVESRDPNVAARAVRIALFAQALEQALEAAKIWVDVEPDNPDAHKALAPLLLAFGRAPEAITHYQKFQALSVGLTDRGFLTIARQLSRDKNSIAALSVMNTLVKDHSDFPFAWLAHAQLTMRQARLDDALESVNKTLELRSHWPPAVILRARILSLQGERGEAIAYLERERSGELEDNVSVGLSYARLLAETDQVEKARDEFERLISLEPRNIEALYAAGVLSVQMEDFPQAEKRLKQVLRQGQRSLEANYYLGRVYEKKKDPEQALTHFLAVRHGEFYLNAQARAASIIADMGRLDRAREHLHTVRVANDQEQVRLYLVEGELLRKAGKHQEAMDFLTEKLKEMPEDTSLRYARALIAEKLSRLDIAEKDLLMIIEREPSNAQALNALGYTLADRTERYEEALKYIERALAVQPEDAAIIDSMGWIQYRLGNHEKAIEHLRRALELIKDPEIAAHLGEVLWDMGNRQGAIEVWEDALKDHPDHKVLLDVMKRFGL
ncbi:tetratricopeptide repeat protein [Kaarinaea lacus]